MNRDLYKTYRTIAAVLIFTASLVAVSVLLGWMFNLELLRRGITGSISTNPVTALLFLVACLPLYFSTVKNHKERLIQRWPATLVLLIGLARLAEILTGVDVGLSSLLFSAKVDNEPVVNTMAPNTAGCFALIGGALLLDSARNRQLKQLADWLAMICVFVATFCLVGYLYQAPEFYNIRTFTPMAFPTTINFFLIGTAILLVRGNEGLFKLFLSPHTGSLMARVLLPCAYFIPIAVGKMRLFGESHYAYSPRLGTSLFAMFMVISFSILIWRCAVWLNNLGKQLNNEVERTKLLKEELHLEQIKAYEHTLAQEKSQQHKRLAQASIDAQEKEKRQIGMELHDHINQILASTKMYIEMARESDDLRDELLTKSHSQLTTAINDIRSLSKSMVLHSSENGGVYLQLLEMLDNVERSSGIKFTVNISDKVMNQLNTKQQIAIYRITEEQVNNIIKYAATPVVMITLEHVDNEILLHIQDQGRGFDMLSRRSGIGLANISTRAALLGGTMQIDSAPGRGCSLTVRFPPDAQEK